MEQEFTQEDLEFCKRVSERLRKRLGFASDESEEFLSASFEGFLTARRTFDPKRGASFKSWAYLVLRRFVVESVRTRHLSKRAHEKQRELDWDGKLYPELAATQAERGLALGFTLSASKSGNDLGTLTIATLPDQEKEVHARECSEILNRAIAQLTPKQRKAIRRRYFDGATRRELQSELGFKRSSSVSILLSKSRKALREILESQYGLKEVGNFL